MYFNFKKTTFLMKKILLFLLFIYASNIVSQSAYRSPLDIPLILSANFGELRPNHFHSGIDLKTQGVINKPVYSIADGYISRISVSPSGYGLAVYIDHPNGQTSVYGHLEKFAPKIAEYVKDKQYEYETYAIDLALDASVFPLKKGDLFAYSGNTGSSGGPHVHFEIRNTENQLALDALEYYKTEIKDGTPPQVKGIAVYPVGDKGAVNNSNEVYRKMIGAVQRQKKGVKMPSDSIFAWGRIGVGIYAIDRMTGTNNIYGVRYVRLFCNNKQIFSSDISSIDFDKTRMINSLTDFDYWRRKNVFFMKSFIEPGNKLSVYVAENNGYIDISEERVYQMKYELEDLYGNSTTYTFDVYGKKQNIESSQCMQRMNWNRDNTYSGNMFSLSIPQGALYNDFCLNLKRSLSPNYLSAVYQITDNYIPLDKNCEMTLKMTKDSLVNKVQYGVVRIRNGKESWLGGKYNNGAMTVRVKELGDSYTVSYDSQAPVITPILPAKWVAQGAIKIKISDNKSGVASYRGTIDGSFALFEHDVKSPFYIYRFDVKKLKKGEKHTLRFVATDYCGNESSYEYSFSY